MARVLNGYSRYFNTKHKRIGPLWSGRFKSVLITNDEQLLHLTRYIHLNPTSAGLVKKPGDWPHSSYKEYVDYKVKQRICKYKEVIEMSRKEYKKFTEDRKDYQREISVIKNLTIDDYSG
jgi:putative transposase